MKRFQCNICGFVYDESIGDPEHGIKASTRWEDIPANWTCPGWCPSAIPAKTSVAALTALTQAESRAR